MKKIIVAIDGLQYSESATAYAVHLAKQTHSFLAGIFLDDFTYHSFAMHELVDTEVSVEEKMKTLDRNDYVTRKEAVELFEKSCQNAGLEYSIHHDKSLAVQELLHESIYADLLIVDGKDTLNKYGEKMPTRFTRDLLAEAQCPVMVVPPTYHSINKLILLYDGSPSSVSAIRNFSSTLPALKFLETEVVTVKEAGDNLHIPDNRLMKEFMKRHFPDATYKVLKGIPADEIENYLEKQPDTALTILGAYHRGLVSRWFKKSMADVLMQSHHCPLYIAHNH